MAELSDPVDKIEFERSWESLQTLNTEPRVEFAFVGRTVSAIVHSDLTLRWPSASFQRCDPKTKSSLQYSLALK
jgi:hypothetical protein